MSTEARFKMLTVSLSVVAETASLQFEIDTFLPGYAAALGVDQVPPARFGCASDLRLQSALRVEDVIDSLLSKKKKTVVLTVDLPSQEYPWVPADSINSFIVKNAKVSAAPEEITKAQPLGADAYKELLLGCSRCQAKFEQNKHVWVLSCGHAVCVACAEALGRNSTFQISCACCSKETTASPVATAPPVAFTAVLEMLELNAEAGAPCPTHDEPAKHVRERRFVQLLMQCGIQVCLEKNCNRAFVCSECRADGGHVGHMCIPLAQLAKDKRFLIKDKLAEFDKWLAPVEARASELMSAALAVGCACAQEVPPPLLASASQAKVAPAVAHFAQFARFGGHFVDSSDYFNELREETLATNSADPAAAEQAGEVEEGDTGLLPHVKGTIHSMIRTQLQELLCAEMELHQQAERLAWIQLRHLEVKLVQCGRTVHRGLCTRGYAKAVLDANDAVLVLSCDKLLSELMECCTLEFPTLETGPSIEMFRPSVAGRLGSCPPLRFSEANRLMRAMKLSEENTRLTMDDVPTGRGSFVSAVGEPLIWPGARMPVTWDVELVRSAKFSINIGICEYSYDAAREATAIGAYSTDVAWMYQCCSGEKFHGGKKRVINGKDVYLSEPYGKIAGKKWVEGDRVGVYIEFLPPQDEETKTKFNLYFTKNGKQLNAEPAFSEIELGPGSQLCPVVDMADPADSVRLVPKPLPPVVEAIGDLRQEVAKVQEDVKEFEELERNA